MAFELTRYTNNPLLKANSSHSWEAGAVFNPCVILEKGIFHMFYRAVASGFKPRLGGGYTNYISSIGYARSFDGIHFSRFTHPFIRPEYPWEKFGCEDPRATKLGDTYYILYTAVASPAYQKNVKIRIALATTKNFRTVTKHGVVGPDMKTKAAVLFHEKISGRTIMLFTLFPDEEKSSILAVSFKNTFELIRPLQSFWKKFVSSLGEHVVFSATKNVWRGPEVGAPPIRTASGWLLIFCGESSQKEWTIDAALLDLKKPNSVLAQSKASILRPQKKYERVGLIPNVTFPEGAVIVGKKVYVYYGGADKYCCLATCRLSDLLNSLEPARQQIKYISKK